MFSALTKTFTSRVLITFRQGYKSSISLDKLYPKSNLDVLEKPEIKLDQNAENFSGYIPIDKLVITNKTCSKPGGQHNVLTSTRRQAQSGVEVRFHVDTSEWIPKWIREKLREKYINRISKEGYLIVRSEKTRKALLNQADCLEQIRSMIHQASFKPKGLSPDEKLKIEIDKKIADGKRLIDKRKISERKSFRRHPVYDSAFDYYGK